MYSVSPSSAGDEQTGRLSIRLNERSGFIFVTARLHFARFGRTTLQETEEGDDEG